MSLYYSQNINLENLVDKLGDAVAIANHDMIFVAANQNFSKIYGLSPEQLIGKDIFSQYPEFKTSVFYKGAEDTMLSGLPSTRVGYSNNLGKWIVVRTAKFDEFHTIMSVHSVSKDFNQSAYLNNIDPLTSLNNRYSLEEEMDNLLRYNQQFSFILLDVLKFKSINDAFGSQTGNLAIMEIAARIKKCLTDNHKVYRFDGNQFAILTPNTNRTLVDIEHIIRDFKKPFIINHIKIDLNISIAYYNVKDTVKDYNTIISDTEEILNVSKKKKNRALEVVENMSQHKEKKIIIANELKKALLNKELVVYYQPQFDIKNNKISNAEALIRWNHPIRGIISPLEFLPVAEEFDLMGEIDRYVILQVSNDIQHLKLINLEIPISINLSSTSITNNQTFEFFNNVVQKSNLDFSLFSMEITENNFIDDFEISKNIINKFVEKNTSISIDDFGKGYSSIHYILNYPSNYLKIDKEFISDIHIKENQKTIVSNVIKMCHGLGIKVVAEGVETKSELEVLKKINCDIIQGYLFSKPLDFQSFTQFLIKHSQINHSFSFYV